MGRNITTTAAALHEPLAVTITGDAVTVGDYVRVEASGAGRRAVDGLSLAAQNTGTGVTALAGLGATAHVAATNYGGSVQPGRLLAVLGNGNVACLHAGDGTSASNALTCRIYSPLKAQVAVVAVTAAASISVFRVFKLGANNFAVCWVETSALKMAVYSNAGAVVSAAITVATLGSGAMSRWNAAALANGDLLLAYDKTATGGMFFSRYNASGALQGAETTVEAAVAADYVCVLPLAAGGFWVYYYRSTATAAYKFARYNAAGVLQGALTTVFTGSANLTAGLSENYAIELANGNVALVDPTTGTVSAVRLYDGAGTFLATITNNTGLGSGLGPNNTMPRAKSGGGFYIATFNGLIAQYDNAGNRLVSGTAPTALPGSNQGLLIERVATGPVLFYTNFDSSSTGSVSAMAWDASLTAEATALTVQATTTTTFGLWAELMPCGLLAYTFCSTAVTGVSVHGRLAPQAASLLGLAITAGSDGQAVTVATAGRWRANQTMPAVSFDRRSSVPVGCKAIITGGTTAVLLGIVA
ncbi:hypothetical protein LJR118_002881 [Acidovorax sp. LjRoot118]|uniref:hypothetical protein n=1 Tax=Acidovorax sp. LjRoot118 TaxID=3342256 RepID=UPI003ECED921